MEVGARHEYKSAAEQLTELGFSGPARQATEELAQSVTAQLTDAIAQHVKISPEEAGQLINGGPYLADQPLAKGLFDEHGYRTEVYPAVPNHPSTTPIPLP